MPGHQFKARMDFERRRSIRNFIYAALMVAIIGAITGAIGYCGYHAIDKYVFAKRLTKGF